MVFFPSSKVNCIRDQSRSTPLGEPICLKSSIQQLSRKWKKKEIENKKRQNTYKQGTSQRIKLWSFESAGLEGSARGSNIQFNTKWVKDKRFWGSFDLTPPSFGTDLNWLNIWLYCKIYHYRTQWFRVAAFLYLTLSEQTLPKLLHKTRLIGYDKR